MLNAKNGTLEWGDTFASGVNYCTTRFATEIRSLHHNQQVKEITQETGKHYLAAGGNDNTLRFYSREKDTPVGGYVMDWYSKRRMR